MSMAINRVSANSVAAMLYPVAKLNRPAKVASSGSNRASAATTPSAVQGTSGPQPANTSAAAEQDPAAFQFAKAALSSAVNLGAPAQSNTDGQFAGVQQANIAAYTPVEQQAGQTFDMTA
jgi:hypothetical protein